MKTDPDLGNFISERLVELGIETPIVQKNRNRMLQREMIEQHFNAIMTLLHLDLSNDSLKETPKRVAKMYVSEIFEGLDYRNFPACTRVNNDFEADEMIVVSGINVSSTCEHHFQNIEGTAKVAYIPNKKVLGLSKIGRVVRFFSKRPQIQERLTLQIHAALCLILKTENVAVEISAVHHCVKARGLEDHNELTTTRKISGSFKTGEARNEFLNSK